MNRLTSVLAIMLLGTALTIDTVQAAATRKSGSKSAPVLAQEAAQAAGVSVQETKNATKLYTTKCMRCHKSYEPNTYTQAEWDSWMSKMKKKAHLSAEQEDLLFKYLAAYRGSALARTNGGTVISEPEKPLARAER